MLHCPHVETQVNDTCLSCSEVKVVDNKGKTVLWKATAMSTHVTLSSDNIQLNEEHRHQK